jgi:hypothetical protein
MKRAPPVLTCVFPNCGRKANNLCPNSLCLGEIDVSVWFLCFVLLLFLFVFFFFCLLLLFSTVGQLTVTSKWRQRGFRCASATSASGTTRRRAEAPRRGVATQRRARPRLRPPRPAPERARRRRRRRRRSEC